MNDSTFNSLFEHIDQTPKSRKRLLGSKYTQNPEQELQDKEVVIEQQEEELQETEVFIEDSNQQNQSAKKVAAPTIMLHSTGIFGNPVVANWPGQKVRKSHTESLKEKPKVKTFSSAKVQTNSYREKLLTALKKIATVQQEHGGEEDFVVIMKNNVQKPNKQSTTAGKYIFQGAGPLLDGFLNGGLEYDHYNYVKLENNWSLKPESDESIGQRIEKLKEEQSKSREARRQKRNRDPMDEDEESAKRTKRGNLDSDQPK